MCGERLCGPYCHRCGQPSRAAPRPLREVLSGSTGRLAHTLRIIVTAPGELAREVDEARNQRSLRPLTLVFHLAALFFLVSTFTGFGIEAVRSSDTAGGLAALIAERRDAATVPAELYMERLERRFQTLYTLLVPAIALGYGALIGLLHWRRKRWSVALVGGIQYLCFVYLWLGLLLATARAAGVNPYAFRPVQVVGTLVGLAYATLTIRRMYDERWVHVAWKGALVVLGGAALHNLLLILALLAALATV
jgi:hypothetical protein